MDAADPETFITAVAAVLSDYPEAIVARVTDPRTGLPGKQQFPPSAYEVKLACDAELLPLRREQERRARAEAASRMLPPPVDRSRRPDWDELKAKFGADWGIKGERAIENDERFMTDEQIKARAKARLPELAEDVKQPLTASPILTKRIAEMIGQDPPKAEAA